MRPASDLKPEAPCLAACDLFRIKQGHAALALIINILRLSDECRIHEEQEMECLRLVLFNLSSVQWQRLKINTLLNGCFRAHVERLRDDFCFQSRTPRERRGEVR